MKIQIGDIIKYTSNQGLINVREVGGISKLAGGKTFLVDNDQQGDYHYHVNIIEIIEHYTREEHPEYFL